MPTNWTENYLRLHLLNNESAVVLRATFKEIVRKTSNGDVDMFLKEFEQDIKTLHKLSYTQRKILYPTNGRTNVDDWDVSLLCFILTTCCTLEGRIHIGKLRDLMKKQTSAFTDIDAFLAYNQNEIDEMRRNGEINQEQYNTLYPQTSPKRTILNDWELNLLLSMLAAFCIGQKQVDLFNILKNCVKRDVRLHCAIPDLAEYLKIKQAYCQDMLRSGKILQDEYDQLFPKTGQFSDVHNWDNNLVKVFVANVCLVLEGETVGAINVVKQIRNEMVAHNGTAEIETGEFLKTWTKLYTAIRLIITQEVPNLTQQWTQKYNKLLDGPFDMKGAISILKEYYIKEASLKDIVTKLEQKTEVESRKRKAEYRNGKKERAKLIKISQGIGKQMQYLIDSNRNKDMYTEAIDAEIIEVRIGVSGGTKETIEKTESMLRLSIQNLLKGKEADIHIKTVVKLVEGITIDGTEIVDVQSGSILLKVKCTTLKGITKLLMHTECQELHQVLKKDLKAEFGEDIRLECGITEKSKLSIINDLELIKNKNDIQKPFVFRDTDIMIKETADIAPSESKEESTTETPTQPLIAEVLNGVVNPSTTQTETADKAPSEIKDESTTEPPSQPLIAKALTGVVNRSTTQTGTDTKDNTTEATSSQSLQTETCITAAVTSTTTTTTTTTSPDAAVTITSMCISTPNDPDDIVPSEIEDNATKDIQSQLITEPFVAATTTMKKLPKAEMIKTFDIKCHGDKYNCRISSCTVLPTSDIVMCDFGNVNVKLFDKYYTYRSVLKLPDCPYESSRSGDNNTDVLVTVPGKKTIYRVKVGDDIKVNNMIGLWDKCWGITCCIVGIAVVLGDKDRYIQLLRYDGTPVIRLKTSIHFTYESRISSIMKGRQVVIADFGSSCVISLDVDTGKTVFEYTDDELRYPASVTSDSQDNIYVVGWNSNNVHIISSTGEKVGVILTRTDGLYSPNGLEYNRCDDTIFLQPDLRKGDMCVYKIIK